MHRLGVLRNAGYHLASKLTCETAMNATAYTLPESTYKDWTRNEHPDFVPTDRQKLVMDVVRQALDAGLYYSSEVREFAKGILKPTEQELARGSGVEGGEFGMDVYYARQTLTAMKRHAVDVESWQHLRPAPGMVLGTIMFSDYKRITGATIVGIEGEGDRTTGKGMSIVFEGKRGSVTVRGTTTATHIRNAIDRALEQGLRKVSFEDLHAPKAPAKAAKKAAGQESGAELALF